MRNIKLTLAYDGTHYHGWQFQPGVPTVQGELNQAIERILDHEVSSHGSGRTDAGVHAHAQVVNFRTERQLETEGFQRGLNALLPPEIRVIAVEEVSLDFHARTSAHAKTYGYHLWRSQVVPPFRVRYVHPVRQGLDTDMMDRATRHFVGLHDFTAFASASSSVRDPVREVYQAHWERRAEEWVFRVRANGFLQHMVRTIVGTLIEVGRGRIRPDEIPAILEGRDRKCAGPSAPAKGLHLIAVEY